MQPNGAKWQCAIRRREREKSDAYRATQQARQNRFYHEKQKHDPLYLLDRALREMTRIRVR
jgi:hypothetical protein